ncbi:hypothetical protein [Ralstonia phage phiRSL1]|uniref:Uncharacterized protein n=1 Tax=Ralstonia phage phiRSL1 TaxID=1980924 RepID=B2ZXN9_9CAUD|nr:hypothetical protein RSL1_ORF019 [Ralstonia phage phiRSL1]BAG41464.1 hypothetical protein [Ralstonia phage phiRSL1]
MFIPRAQFAARTSGLYFQGADSENDEVVISCYLPVQEVAKQFGLEALDNVIDYGFCRLRVNELSFVEFATSLRSLRRTIRSLRAWLKSVESTAEENQKESLFKVELSGIRSLRRQQKFEQKAVLAGLRRTALGLGFCNSSFTDPCIAVIFPIEKETVMKTAIVLSTVVASIALYANTGHALSPAVDPEPAISYSLLVYGASAHMDKVGHIDNRTFRPTGNRKLNAVNPGSGFGKRSAMAGWSVPVRTRTRSTNRGYMAYGGYRFKFGDEKGWNANVALKAGYLHGSNRHGLMALPTVGVGYKNVSLEFSAFPYHTDDKGGKGIVVATWLRYQF